MMRKTGSFIFSLAAIATGMVIVAGIFCPLPLLAQEKAPQFEVDPSWPKPFPDGWVTGELGGVCVDAQDNVFITNRRDLTEIETESSHQAPPIIEIDSEGNVVNSFGDPNVVPIRPHGCFVDNKNNFWIDGSSDGIVQEYSHDGSKLLLQIGTRGVYDTSDGTIWGRALNSSHTQFFKPADIAVDPANGDVYVADGYGNRRVAVFNHNGQFLRQWGQQGTKAEVAAHKPGVFMQVVHCVAIGNDGLVYVCDRQGDRIEVFDKMGNFKRNIFINKDPFNIPKAWANSSPLKGGWGSAWDIAFSPDRAQKFMYVADGRDETVWILDRASGKILSHFGRGGHQVGEFTHCHAIATDSKGNIYVAESVEGRRVQKFRIVNSQ